MNAPALVFGNTAFDVVDRDGQVWLRGLQIGGALGYAKPDHAIWKIYESNKQEFTDHMTAIIRLHTAGGMQEVRIFSLRGAHLLGMLARTDKAAAFRRWVLDILDGLIQPAVQPDEEMFERSEQLVSAARVYNAFLRVGRSLRLGDARAAVAANTVASRHTGIDVLREMAIDPQELLAAAELTAIGGEADTLAERLKVWLETSAARDVTTDEAIAGLGLSVGKHERRGAQVRIGILLSRLGWRKREYRNHYTRRIVYQRPELCP